MAAAAGLQVHATFVYEEALGVEDDIKRVEADLRTAPDGSQQMISAKQGLGQLLDKKALIMERGAAGWI